MKNLFLLWLAMVFGETIELKIGATVGRYLISHIQVEKRYDEGEMITIQLRTKDCIRLRCWKDD
jgi:hypothetical protein